MKFLLISPKNRTVYNFRGELIKEILSKGYEVVVTGPDRENIDRILSLGVRFAEIPLNKNGINVFSDIRYFIKLKKIIRQEKPDVTLGYTVKPVIYGSIAARTSGVKNVNCLITGGGYIFASKTLKAKIIGAIARILYKIGLGCANRVIFQNPDDMAEFTAKKLVKPDKCATVYGSGVDMEKFTPQPMPEKMSFFMLSRLLKSKGVEEYLKAADIIKKKYPDVRFSVLGKYEYSMQDAVPEEFVKDYIDRGIVERYDETEDVISYYKKCSVYVLPSYREGTPRTVLEAMACGRPIITTDSNGCRQTVTKGENGFLVPVGDAESLACAMEKFILEPHLAEQMGKMSVSLCREKFDVTKVNKEMLLLMRI